MAKKKPTKQPKTKPQVTEEKPKHPGGRPSKYQDIDHEVLKQLCLLGATDENLAAALGVAVSTIYEWKKDYPEFSEALKRYKYEHDEKVAQMLQKSALGYEKEYSEEAVTKDGDVVTVKKMLVCPPNPTSAIFWLKNRQPELWRDKVQVDANVNGNIVHEIDYSKLPTDVLKQIIDAAKPKENK